MAAYTVENLTIAGIPLDDATSFTPVSSSDTFVNDGVTFLWIKAANTVTANLIAVTGFVVAATPPGLGPITLGNYSFTPVAGVVKEWLLGPFAPGRFNNNGLVTVTYTNINGLSAKAVRLVPIP